MKKNRIPARPSGILVAALLVCALSVTAFAYGGRIVSNVYHFVSGGIVEQGIDENGDNYASGSVDTSTPVAPAEIGEDGRLYLIANQKNLDITDLCSYTIPYIYDIIGEDGLRHAIVIGGNLDAIGWSEFIWDENGLPAAGSSDFGTSGGRDDAPWLNEAMKTLNLPW